jgi:hypothetical protein
LAMDPENPSPSRAKREASARPAARQGTMQLGLHAEAGLRDLAEEIADGLGEDLNTRYDEVVWEVSLIEGDGNDVARQTAELIAEARRRTLGEGCDLAISLTTLPVRKRGRPVIALTSAMDRVGLISVPALGAIGPGRRAREAALNLVEGLLGEAGGEGSGRRRGARGRVGGRLRELVSPLGAVQVRDQNVARFSTAVVRGNLRLLLGMVRANDPARVVTRLSRAMVAALGTAAYVLASFSIWQLAVNLGWPRLLALTLLTLIAACVTLIAAHDLWEQSSGAEDRERVVLFNAATTLTIVLGVLTLYGALFLVSAACTIGLVPGDFFSAQTDVPADLPHLLELTWFTTSLASLAGALGSLTESDLAVREAAYGYHPDARVEDADDSDGDDPH